MRGKRDWGGVLGQGRTWGCAPCREGRRAVSYPRRPTPPSWAQVRGRGQPEAGGRLGLGERLVLIAFLTPGTTFGAEKQKPKRKESSQVSGRLLPGEGISGAGPSSGGSTGQARREAAERPARFRGPGGGSAPAARPRAPAARPAPPQAWTPLTCRPRAATAGRKRPAPRRSAPLRLPPATSGTL